MTDRVVRLEAMSEPDEKADLAGLVVLAALQSDEARRALNAAFQHIDGASCNVVDAGHNPINAYARAVVAPDVFFMEAADEERASTLIKELRALPNGLGARVAVLMPDPSRTATVRLLRDGADDVFATAPDDIEITRCLARAVQPVRVTAPAANAELKEVRTLVFMHAAGGAGATTMAVNTAVQLAQREKGGVCLIDLDLQFGDVDLHLDLPMRSRVVDIVNTPDRLDARMLEDLMIDGPGGLKVLTAPDMAMPLDIFRPQTIDAILSLARRRFRYVVVDMPMALSHWTDVVLRRADRVFLVTQVNVPALRATRRLIDTLREENATAAPITVVANRYGGKGALTKINLQQAAKALGSSIGVVCPSDYPLLVESLDQGVPASLLRPQSKYVQTLARAIDSAVGAGSEAGKADAPQAVGRSFFGLGRK